jgi:hypothetical protein
MFDGEKRTTAGSHRLQANSRQATGHATNHVVDEWAGFGAREDALVKSVKERDMMVRLWGQS